MAPVFLLKILSFMIVTALSLENNILRQGLLLLPSHFLEGVVLAGLIPVAVGQTFSGKVRDRVYPSAGVYVLLKLVLSFVMGMVFLGQTLDIPQETQAPAGGAVWILVAGLIVCTLWAFRLLWLYVPVALGYSMRSYLKGFRGWRASYDMMGLWVLSFIPLVLVMIVCSEILALLVPGAHDEPPSVIFSQILAVFQAMADSLITLVSSLGMAYGIHSVLQKKDTI